VTYIIFVGVLASGVEFTGEKKSIHSIVEATKAAFTILDTFSGIFIQGQPYDVHPTVRIGLHIGEPDIQCTCSNNVIHSILIHIM